MPKKRDFTPHRRESRNLPPEKLYDTLCGIFPEQIAAEKFEQLMGFPPTIRKEQNTKLELNLEVKE